jgi:hypothetical protein
MKLGQALSERARQAQKLSDLKKRITASAIKQEDTEPTEDCGALLEEFVAVSRRHARLVGEINKTNQAVRTADGKLLGDLLRDREAYIRERNMFREACDAASNSGGYRYSRSEIKYIPAIDVKMWRDSEVQADAMIASLDAQIQALNWQFDLIED